MFRIATSSNKVVKTDLSVTYEVERNDAWYVVTRHATKSYSIVDLDAESAAVIANQRVAIYTRPYSVLVSSGGDTAPSVRSLTNCLAKVSPRHDTGPVWRVDVDVDETDVKVSATEPADPATLFTAENARDYDETDDIAKTAAVTSAEYDGTNAVIAFSSNFGDDVICQKFNTSENAWEPIFVQPSDGTITIPDGAVVGGDRVRVISGRTKSAEVVVETVEPPPPPPDPDWQILSIVKDFANLRITGTFKTKNDIAPGRYDTADFVISQFRNGAWEYSMYFWSYYATREDLSSNTWNLTAKIENASWWADVTKLRIGNGIDENWSDPFDI